MTDEPTKYAAGDRDPDDLTPPGGVRIIPRVDVELANLSLRALHLAERLQEAVRLLGQAGREHRQAALIDIRDVISEAGSVFSETAVTVEDLRREEQG